MTINNSTSILWLSDIHWSIDYHNKINIEKFPYSDFKSLDTCFQKFINAFFLFLERYNDENPPIDYLIISGDIADKGLLREYVYINTFIKKIKLYFPIIQVILVPGNHDVTIGIGEDKIKENFQPLSEIIKEQKISTKEIENKLFKDSNFYKKLFGNFICFKNKNINKNEIIETEPIKVEKTGFTNDIYFDKNNELIFFTLNSSWYAFTEDVIDNSITDSFLESMLFNFLLENTPKSSNDIKGAKKLYNTFLKVHTFMTQYGNQSFGPVSSVNTVIDRVIEYRKKCEKPVVICSFHHPPAWFIYDDKYKLNGPSILKRIYEISDLVLTGHEHIEFVNPDILRGRTLFFRAPLFLDKSILQNTRDAAVLPKNGFRILTISNDHNSVIEKRYKFSHNDDNITVNILEDHEYEINPNNTKDYYKNILAENVRLDALQKSNKCKEIIEGFVNKEEKKKRKKTTEAEKIKIIYEKNDVKVFYHFNSFYVINLDYTEDNLKIALEATNAIKKHLMSINKLLSNPDLNYSDLSKDKYSIPFLKHQKELKNPPFNSNIYFVNFDFMNSSLKALDTFESDIQLKEYILKLEMKDVDGFLKFKNAFFNQYEDKYQEIIKLEQESSKKISTLLKEFNTIKECRFISKFVKSIHI